MDNIFGFIYIHTFKRLKCGQLLVDNRHVLRRIARFGAGYPQHGASRRFYMQMRLFCADFNHKDKNSTNGLVDFIEVSGEI